jgi:hypothetical protein
MPSSRRWQHEGPEIRASDAERERVVAFLRDKAAEGRLTPDELDERVGRAYAAVTRGELDRLVRDLPEPPLQRPRRSAGRPPARRAPRPRGGAVVLAFAALAALRLPGLAVLLVWTGLALTVALVAIVAVLAVALGPVIAIVMLAVLLLRRRSWGAPGLR